MDSKAKLKTVDLFCGCGGISAGLRDAGFEIIAGADIDPKQMSTFRSNFPNARSMRIDLTEWSPYEFMEALEIQPGELDLLAGGPPCQGFSKNVPRKLRDIADANNLLTRTFIDYCEIVQPKLILMENVAEMKNGFSSQFTDEILTRLSNLGYTVTSMVLNAAEYGVPQIRRRAFFLAVKGSTALEEPPQTHRQSSQQHALFDRTNFVTVWEAIGDLPSLRHGEGNDPCEYACKPFSDYQHVMRNGNSLARNHVARHLSPTQYARLASIQPGQGHKDLPDNLKVRGGYSGAYGRLEKGAVARTITRWVFHPGSGRWGHPVDTRTLTMREAARLQGFTDDYEFTGSFVQQAGQIGNAVPPLLVKQIGISIRQQLSI